MNAADALLAAPPVLLLLFRDADLRPSRRAVGVWLALSLPLGWLLAAADAQQAGVYRTAARRIAGEIGAQPGARWFVGHWGLQHYLEREGFQSVVPPMYGRSDLAVGDWVATGRNISQLDVSQNMQRFTLEQTWAWDFASLAAAAHHQRRRGRGLLQPPRGLSALRLLDAAARPRAARAGDRRRATSLTGC